MPAADLGVVADFLFVDGHEVQLAFGCLDQDVPGDFARFLVFVFGDVGGVADDEVFNLVAALRHRDRPCLMGNPGFGQPRVEEALEGGEVFLSLQPFQRYFAESEVGRVKGGEMEAAVVLDVSPSRAMT